jgi:putative beta-barrel porin MtrB/PioB
MTTKHIVRLLAVAALLCAGALPASAQWGPAEEQNCFLKGNTGSITLSAQGGNGLEDSSKLQQFETIPKGVFVPCALFGWDNTSYFIDAKGTKLGLDDQFASVLAGKKGGASLHLTWDQNPNWMSNTAQTPYSETTSGNIATFHVPDGMRTALQNVYAPWVTPTASNPAGVGSAPANPTVPGFFAVEPWVAQSAAIDLRYLRKTGLAGLEIPVGKDFVFNASYSHETRNGNKNTTFYGGPDYEVATPIDYKTEDFRFAGDYAKGNLFANLTADFNNFTNEVQYAEIDNPERLQLKNPNFPNARTVYNDAAFFRLWLPPDNKAYQVDLTAGYTLPKHHKVTGSLSTGQMKMDHELLDISTNPDLGTQPINPAFTVVPPYGSVEAKYDTFMLNFRLTGDPSPYFGYIASYRKFEMKDKTEEYEFLSSARGDVGASQRVEGGAGEAGALIREHFGWSIETLRGEVHVLPVHGLRVGLSYNQDNKKFDLGPYAELKDKTLAVNVDWGWRWVNLHGGFNNFKRDPGAAHEPPIWEGATFTDTAQRDRNTWNALLTLTPVDKLAVSVNALTQKNDFPSSVTGLLDQTFDTYGVDVTYVANAKLNLTAGYVYEKYYFNMEAAYIPRGLNPPFDPANLWQNATNDKVDTFRAGLSWALVPDKVDFDATFDYTKPRSDSQYQFALPGTPIGGLNEANGVFPANVPPIPGFTQFSFDSFPLVTKKFIMAKLRLAYHIGKNLTASAMYWKQKYDNTDWTTDLMQPYMGHVDPGANRWFFLGARVPSYDANIFRASLTYTF